MADIRLLATDLDGTLLGSAGDFSLYPEFREQLTAMRRRHNAVWAVCTGRSVSGFEQIFAPMRLMGVDPDFVIARHAFLYSVRGRRFVPHVLWNVRTFFDLVLSQWKIRHALAEWHRLIARSFFPVRVIKRQSNRLWLRFEKEDSAVAAADLLRTRAQALPHLRVFKYLQEIDVRVVPFTKGIAVSELTRHLRLAPADVLAIGNGHNDISMFDPSVAGQTGCPAGSEVEVVEAVHRVGGHVARGLSLAGTLEIIRAWENGTVRSELPDVSPVADARPNPHTPRNHYSHQGPLTGKKACLMAGGAYVVLLALASCGIIPFSDLILRPYLLVLEALGQAFLFLTR
jgi:HAD superfamily hydrolase (TIGR01484 family)